MALSLPDLTAARDSLFMAIAGGVTAYRDQNGESVTYASMGEMRSALAMIDSEIARASSRPASTILFKTSKGL
jgi:hypothetical protein